MDCKLIKLNKAVEATDLFKVDDLLLNNANCYNNGTFSLTENIPSGSYVRISIPDIIFSDSDTTLFIYFKDINDVNLIVTLNVNDIKDSIKTDKGVTIQPVSTTGADISKYFHFTKLQDTTPKNVTIWNRGTKA